MQQCLAQENGWTIMYYAAGSNSSEVNLLDDVQQIKENKLADGYEIIMLIDRIEGHSQDSLALGKDFIDTKLFRFGNQNFQELSGGTIMPELNLATQYEANMGDAQLLKNFIQFCKANYPAKNYMLILRSHGNGQAMCPDDELEERDPLYPGEIKAVLTGKESVDILGLDVCSMAGLENFYEWRPANDNFSADYIIASAPLSGAWPYEQILKRLSKDKNTTGETDYFAGTNEKNYDPHNVSPLEMSKLIIEEIYDNQTWASWGLFDNSKIDEVKGNIDALSMQLVNEKKPILLDILKASLHYDHNMANDLEIAQLTFPYVDAYDFICRMSNHEELSEKSRNLATKTSESIDELTVNSFYGNGYLPPTESFVEGKSGVYLIVPMGDNVFSRSGRSFWAHTTWYHPDDKSASENSYGFYDWCRNGANPNNGKVENFFELLDYLFDEQNDEGGVNQYNY
ncbi:MAG: clostripain [Saprospiraceae bacterium]|nr:MAG: clostripain [Saprospiraceae bacterium]